MAVAAVKAKNALLGPMDTILKLPLPNGIVTETEYPPTITHLAVSGSECLPNGGDVNTWNAKKGRILLRELNEEVSDSEGESTDANALAKTSLRCRLKLANALGVSNTQLSMACQRVNDF